MTDSSLPPEFDSLLAEQPEPVRAMWRYALVLMMIDDEKARVVGNYNEGERLYLLVETVAGERFTIEHPLISKALERFFLEHVRKIVKEEKGES